LAALREFFVAMSCGLALALKFAGAWPPFSARFRVHVPINSTNLR
jgi:hypothetical protein